MSRRRRPRGRPAVPAELTPVAEWDTPPTDAEPEPGLTVATQPMPPDVPRTAVMPAVKSTGLTPELASAVRKTKPCGHCGGWHQRACPRVKRLAWHPGGSNDELGSLASVEFWRDGEWDTGLVLWPEQLAEVVDP